HRPERFAKHRNLMMVGFTAVAVAWPLAAKWMPLGVSNSLLVNFLFIAFILGFFLGAFALFLRYYPRILMWCLNNKGLFLIAPAVILLIGVNTWMGFGRV